MLFRFHRGTLNESLLTTITVYSLDELRAAIGRHMHPDHLGELVFKHVGIDDRIGWDTYLVSEITEDYPQGCAIGHSDGNTFEPQTCALIRGPHALAPMYLNASINYDNIATIDDYRKHVIEAIAKVWGIPVKELIKPIPNRTRTTTNKAKEFTGGYIIASGTDKPLRSLPSRVLPVFIDHNEDALTLDEAAAEIGIIRREPAPIEYTAPPQYEFMEGLPQQITRANCVVMRIKRKYKTLRATIKKRGYQPPRMRWEVTTGPLVIRGSYDAELSRTPYGRDIIAAMDPADKSNEVIIMKGCSHGPTITPGVAAKLYMTDRDGKQTFLGNVSCATITKDGIKKDL